MRAQLRGTAQMVGAWPHQSMAPYFTFELFIVLEVVLLHRNRAFG